MRKILGISLMIATSTMVLLVLFLLRPIEAKKSMMSHPVDISSD